MTEREKDIIKIEEDMAAAFNRKDVEQVLTFFEENLFGFSSTRHEHIEGLDDLRKTFEHYLDEGDKVHYAISDVSVQFVDGVAVASFYWVVTIENGTSVHEIAGRGTHVFRKDKDVWRIIHEHFSRSHH